MDARRRDAAAVGAAGGEGRGGAFLGFLLGDAVRPGCGGARSGDDGPWSGWGAAVSETVRLERDTRYHRRVIADGPASHDVSPTFTFTTGR